MNPLHCVAGLAGCCDAHPSRNQLRSESGASRAENGHRRFDDVIFDCSLL